MCVFIPPEFPKSISLISQKKVELFLYYRDAPRGKIGSKIIERMYHSECSKGGEDSTKKLSNFLVRGGWKMAFKIEKNIPLSFEKDYTSKGNALAVTRFGFYRYPSKWRVPVLLLCEDLD